MSVTVKEKRRILAKPSRTQKRKAVPITRQLEDVRERATGVVVSAFQALVAVSKLKKSIDEESIAGAHSQGKKRKRP